MSRFEADDLGNIENLDCIDEHDLGGGNQDDDIEACDIDDSP